MASPPTTVVPLSVVIAERRVLSTAEGFTAEIIINSRIASMIISVVPCPVDREVSVLIHGYVVVRMKLVGVPIMIKLCVSIHCEVSLAIHRYVVVSTKLIAIPRTIHVEVSRPIHRDVSIAIHRSITSRAKFLVPREVSLAKSLIPREILLAERAHPGVVLDHRI